MTRDLQDFIGVTVKGVSFSFLIFSLMAHAFTNSPFDGRNYRICQDFRLHHIGRVLDVIPSGDSTNNLYVVDISESYFSWGSWVMRGNKNWKIGDNISLEMMHTTSDVVLFNPSITEGFSHSLINVDLLSYQGFLVQPVETVQSINMRSVTEEGEVGLFTTYFLNLVFSSGKKIELYISSSVDLKTIANAGDRIMVANGFLMRNQIYSPNPFGNKKVMQKHWIGPLSMEPVYKKPIYGQVLFNLSRGTMVNL